MLYREFHRIAQHRMRGERSGHTLRTTALVNEAFLRLDAADILVEDRHHLLSLAARTMRRILVDHARARNSVKRGGGAVAVTFDEAALIDGSSGAELLEIDMALEKLGELDPAAGKAIELVFFGGLSYEEAASVMGVSRTSLFEDLRFGKTWLKTELS